MSKKIYVCHECGNVFPSGLTHMIETKVQVYCEKCGTPFSLEGIKFKEKSYPLISKPKTRTIMTDKSESGFNDLIQFLNKVSFIPILIFSLVIIIRGLVISGLVFFGLSPNYTTFTVISNLLLGTAGLIIALYDRLYIYPRVEQGKYNEVMVHAFCWGILGCIAFGTGTILLIKGILIFFYVIFSKKNENLKAYDFGLMLKNSLNSFSAIAGFVIILFGFQAIFDAMTHSPFMMMSFYDVDGGFLYDFSLEELTGFFITTLIALFLDLAFKARIGEKEEFNFIDFFMILIIGIMGTIFFATGIFILLKGVIIFFLMFGKPSKPQETTMVKESTPQYHPQPQYKAPRQQIQETPRQPIQERRYVRIEPIEKREDEKPLIRAALASEKPEIHLTKKEKKEVKEHVKTSEKLKKDLKKKPTIEKVVKLKLHESLLPVKDEKDRELVMQYFSKIFSVLSKDMRKQIINLKISKKEKKDLLQELAFLTAEEQVKYIESLANLYRVIPKKLITRIRSLANVKPEHYGKIIEQLKYMDYEEQLKFIQFLEQNA